MLAVIRFTLVLAKIFNQQTHLKWSKSAFPHRRCVVNVSRSDASKQKSQVFLKQCRSCRKFADNLLTKADVKQNKIKQR